MRPGSLLYGEQKRENLESVRSVPGDSQVQGRVLDGRRVLECPHGEMRSRRHITALTTYQFHLAFLRNRETENAVLYLHSLSSFRCGELVPFVQGRREAACGGSGGVSCPRQGSSATVTTQP